MSCPKIVESAHYHVWTDALHGRALSDQAKNEWDRGTYVRWTVASAWTALETACDEALGISGIGRRFKENLDAAIAERGLPRLTWGAGIWQKVTELQAQRKGFIHLTVGQADLFPGAQIADQAVDTVRQAIAEIYRHAGRASPRWLEDDHDRGWQKSREVEASDHNHPKRSRSRRSDNNKDRICERRVGARRQLPWLGHRHR